MSQLLKVALSNFRSANRPVLDLLNYFSSFYQLDNRGALKQLTLNQVQFLHAPVISIG
jgi:hypothetical protein